MNESDSIQKLEAMLNEFYHHTTSNFKKKEIERELKSFQESDESWRILIHHLGSPSGFNNQYLWFFSVSTIEVSVTIPVLKLKVSHFLPPTAHNHKEMEQHRPEVENADSRLPLADLLQLPGKRRSDAARQNRSVDCLDWKTTISRRASAIHGTNRHSHKVKLSARHNTT